MASKEEPNDSIGELTPPASKQLTDDEVREIIKSLGCLESVKVPAGALYIPGEYGVRTRESAGRRLWTVIARENGYPIVPEWGCTCDACIAYDTVLQDLELMLPLQGNRFNKLRCIAAETTEQELVREFEDLLVAGRGQAVGAGTAEQGLARDLGNLSITERRQAMWGKTTWGHATGDLGDMEKVDVKGLVAGVVACRRGRV